MHAEHQAVTLNTSVETVIAARNSTGTDLRFMALEYYGHSISAVPFDVPIEKTPTTSGRVSLELNLAPFDYRPRLGAGNEDLSALQWPGLGR